MHHPNLALYILMEELEKEAVFLVKQPNGLPFLEPKALADLELSVQRDESLSPSQMEWILQMMERTMRI